MRIAVTGGTGYVGSHLIARARSQGHEVIIISRSPAPEGEGEARIVYDGTSQSLASALVEWKPDAVVHLAADVRKGHSTADVDVLTQANVVFPMHLAGAAAEVGPIRFVNISTFSTYSRPETYSPQTFYAATKKAAEDLLAFHHQAGLLKVASLCFYDIYGENQGHQRFLPALLKSISSGAALTMSVGEQQICFIHVDDAVDAILFSLEAEAVWADADNNTYTIHGDDVLTLRDVPQIVADVLGVEVPEVRHVLPYRPREIMRFQPPYPRVPGWTPKISFREGVAALSKSLKN